MSQAPVHQRGMALIVVLWMVAAMAVTVAGVVQLSRDEVEIAQLRLRLAQTEAIARGVAIRALRQREAQRSAAALQGSSVQPGPDSHIFRATFTVDGASVDVAMYPAQAFVALGSSRIEDWQQLLQGIGGMNSAQATSLSEGIVSAQLSTGSVGAPAGSFASFAQPTGGATGATVAALMAVEGMPKMVFDRIRPVVAPFSTSEPFQPSLGPLQLSLVTAESRADTVPGEAVRRSYENVAADITVAYSPGVRFTQRIWLAAPNGASTAKVVAVNEAHRQATE